MFSNVLETPFSSLPIIKHKGKLKLALHTLIALSLNAVAYTQKSFFLSWFIASSKLATFMILILLKPPDEIFKTVGVIEAERSLGIIICFTEKAFAERIIAPKFCGSCIWSNIKTNWALSLKIDPRS